MSVWWVLLVRYIDYVVGVAAVVDIGMVEVH